MYDRQCTDEVHTCRRQRLMGWNIFLSSILMFIHIYVSMHGKFYRLLASTCTLLKTLLKLNKLHTNLKLELVGK